MSDKVHEAEGEMLALAEKHGVSVPSPWALDKLREHVAALRGTERWKRCADMTRQTVERYLQEFQLPPDLAPVLAGILAREGEPWALVEAMMIANTIAREKGPK